MRAGLITTQVSLQVAICSLCGQTWVVCGPSKWRQNAVTVKRLPYNIRQTSIHNTMCVYRLHSLGYAVDRGPVQSNTHRIHLQTLNTSLFKPDYNSFVIFLSFSNIFELFYLFDVVFYSNLLLHNTGYLQGLCCTWRRLIVVLSSVDIRRLRLWASRGFPPPRGNFLHYFFLKPQCLLSIFTCSAIWRLGRLWVIEVKGHQVHCWMWSISWSAI